MPISVADEGKAFPAAEFKHPFQTLTDWDGVDDPGNPRNWKIIKKLYATVIPALYAFSVYVAFRNGSFPV